MMTRRRRGVKLSSSSLSLQEGSVAINIYDIHWISYATAYIGLGMYHTGVVVYGNEYSYGYNRTKESGIYQIVPRQTASLVDSMRYRYSLFWGKTKYTKERVLQEIENLGKDWVGLEYNLLHHNCNHFASRFLQFLIGESLPSWINRPANYSSVIVYPLGPFIYLPMKCCSSSSSSKSSKSSSSSSSCSSSSSSSSVSSSSKASSSSSMSTSDPKNPRPIQKKHCSESNIVQIKTSKENCVNAICISRSRKLFVEALDKPADDSTENTVIGDCVEGCKLYPKKKSMALPAAKPISRKNTMPPQSSSTPEFSSISPASSKFIQPQRSHFQISLPTLKWIVQLKNLLHNIQPKFN